MTYFPDARSVPAAAEFLRAYEEAGFQAGAAAPSLVTYAAVQVWAQAVEAAGTTAFAEVERALRSRGFATALGTLRFDAKGDVVGIETFQWYVWRNGAYESLDVKHGP